MSETGMVYFIGNNLRMVKAHRHPNSGGWVWGYEDIKNMNKNNKGVYHDFNDGNGRVPAHKHPNGGGWVADTATVAETAFVGPYATVYGNAKVLEKAYLNGMCSVFENATVIGNASLSDFVSVFGTSTVCGFAKITGHVMIYGESEICDHANISGFCQVNDSGIGGFVYVGGSHRIYKTNIMSGSHID